MATDRTRAIVADENLLGTYLKDCRARLAPETFGFSSTRRRTPGLRREEVAQLAGVSVTWYTWLEQGRGGAPSTDALERIARALDLKPVEREHLFLLAQHRPPEIRYRATEGVTPRIQRVLDALEYMPAYVKTSSWDVLAWNRAAAAVLGDYGAAPPERRNIMRRLFCDPEASGNLPDWERDARFAVATFRTETTRAGACAEVKALVDELCRCSPQFAELWRENDVRTHGEGTKRIRRPGVGLIALDYSAFAVDGRPDLGMVVFTPATPADADRVRALVDAKATAARGA